MASTPPDPADPDDDLPDGLRELPGEPEPPPSPDPVIERIRRRPAAGGAMPH